VSGCTLLMMNDEKRPFEFGDMLFDEIANRLLK
jgi:hypothetical protein